MRGNLFCFLDFYLVGILKNFPGEKTKGNEEPEPMRKTKKQKRKKKKIEETPGGRAARFLAVFKALFRFDLLL